MKALIPAIVGVLLISGCSSGPENFGSGTASNGNSNSSDTSNSDSGNEALGTVLEDCQSYQLGYDAMGYLEFLKAETENFRSGIPTLAQSPEFLDILQWEKDGQFLTLDDVSFEIYATCFSLAEYEINVWGDEFTESTPEEQLPSASTIKEALVVGLLYYCESPNESSTQMSTWTVTSPVAVDGFYQLWALAIGKGQMFFNIDVRNDGYSLITPNDSLAEEALEYWGCEWPMKVLARN